MIMLDRVHRIEEVVVVAEKIFATLSQPMQINSRDLSVSASIGISIFPDDADSREDLIRTADIAMYSAKGQGRNRYDFYTEAMTSAAQRYLEVDQELRHALRNDEFVLYYQPQIDLQNRMIIGAEALIRWRHPQKGLLGPDNIIPFAEESGLILDIGEWVLRTACSQIQHWREAQLPPLRISVNVSAKQMHHRSLIDTIREVLKETGVSQGELEIEITESTLQDEESCLATLRVLQHLGITLAIDDFGTGYSCLSSLKNLPIDRVKIDRAFVCDLSINCSDIAIADAIIAMAHHLGKKVIAEGVETVEQEKLLTSRNCDEAQGYLFAKPMPATEFIELVNSQYTSAKV